MILKDIILSEISDSRGEPTIEVGVENIKGGKFFAQIPSGKSCGTNEAQTLPYGEAARVLEETIKKEIIKKNFKSIEELDRLLIKLDGTINKNKLGGNLMLGISIAFSRALAAEKNLELWQLIRNEFFKNEVEKKLPRIFSNLINGGAHAKNNLDIQEFMVIVSSDESIGQSYEKLVSFYYRLGEYLKKVRSIQDVPLGDEGGYSLDFQNNFEPLSILAEQIKVLNWGGNFALGLDAAASGFYKDDKYIFDEKLINTQELEGIYKVYFEAVPNLVSIEDPFHEKDGEQFGKLLSHLKEKLIIGDDLTTTNPQAIKKAAENKWISGVIIKPNQIGTVTETCEAINEAHKHGIKCIVSHRSGETKDVFIIHLARAANAFGLKIGAPYSERLVKFEEMLRIYS
mgnify:CR=1 FL=1